MQIAMSFSLDYNNKVDELILTGISTASLNRIMNNTSICKDAISRSMPVAGQNQ